MRPKGLDWGHLCLSSQLSPPLDSHTECSLLAVLKEGTEVLITDEVEV